MFKRLGFLAILILTLILLHPISRIYALTPGIETLLIASPNQIIENVPSSIKFTCKNTTTSTLNANFMLTASYGIGGPVFTYITIDSTFINGTPITIRKSTITTAGVWGYSDISLQSGELFTFTLNFTPNQDIREVVGNNLRIGFSCMNQAEQGMGQEAAAYIPVGSPTTPTPIPTTIAPTQAVQPTATVAQTVPAIQKPTPTITESTNELEPVSYITENTDTDSQEDITDNVGEQRSVILSPTTIVALSSAGIISAAGIGFLQFKTHFISSLVLKLLKLFRFK